MTSRLVHLRFFLGAIAFAALVSLGRATEGLDCNEKCESNDQCRGGLLCLDVEGEGKICGKLMEEGGKCVDPCWKCADGLVCDAAQGDTCQKPATELDCNESCESDDQCRGGLLCLDVEGEGKICGKLMEEGGKCVDPCWKCADGLVCDPDQGDTCQKPTTELDCNESCESDDQCRGGLLCLDVEGEGKICGKLMEEGGKCVDPCWKCADGLVCDADQADTCQKPTTELECNEKCENDDQCRGKLQCLDVEGEGKICGKLMEEGGKCVDPCWKCADGLVCDADQADTCQKPTTELECNEKCENDDQCRGKLQCLDVEGEGKICGKLMEEGGKCVDPCWKCADGLVCDADQADTCQPPKRDCNEKCDNDDQCRGALKCIDTPEDGKVCGKLMDEGGSCRDVCWRCADGLSCDESFKCTKPKVQLECGDTCGDSDDAECKSGLSCLLTPEGDRICGKPMGEGGKCKDPCWQCETGLVCDEEQDFTCQKPKVELQCNEECGGEDGPQCKPGLQCLEIDGGKKVCGKLMGEGGKCRDPCWQCDEGLTCDEDRDFTCVRSALQCNEKCSTEDDKCGGALSCIDVAGEGKICGKTMGEGGRCDDPCWKCGEGLNCDPDSKKCVAEPRAKACESCAELPCEDGLWCLRTWFGKYCVVPGEEGDACRSKCVHCHTGYCNWYQGKCVTWDGRWW